MKINPKVTLCAALLLLCSACASPPKQTAQRDFLTSPVVESTAPALELVDARAPQNEEHLAQVEQGGGIRVVREIAFSQGSRSYFENQIRSVLTKSLVKLNKLELQEFLITVNTVNHSGQGIQSGSYYASAPLGLAGFLAMTIIDEATKAARGNSTDRTEVKLKVVVDGHEIDRSGSHTIPAGNFTADAVKTATTNAIEAVLAELEEKRKK
jgi:hypothetical protein